MKKKKKKKQNKERSYLVDAKWPEGWDKAPEEEDRGHIMLRFEECVKGLDFILSAIVT